MSTFKVEMVSGKCDNCGKHYYNDHHGWTAFVDESAIAEEMDNDGWHEDDGKHYCPDCYAIDDDDQLIIKTPNI